MPQRSPFAGMDPWLENHWGDVHHTIISRLADQVARVLPDELFVTVEERSYVVEPADEPVTEGVIEIRRLSVAWPLVTAIEVLSPTNKCTATGREVYLETLQGYDRVKANIVELDLLRCGTHLNGVPLASLRAEWLTPYKCAVRRGGEWAGHELEYYPLPLRRRLPKLRVPIRAGDADVVVDLQEPIDHVYKRGRYDIQIDYARPPDPPLSADDAAWAAACVAAAGR